MMDANKRAFFVPVKKSRLLHKVSSQLPIINSVAQATRGLVDIYKNVSKSSRVPSAAFGSSTDGNGHFVPSYGLILSKRYICIAHIERKGQSAVIINAKNAFMYDNHVCMVLPSLDPWPLSQVIVDAKLNTDQRLKTIRKIAFHLLSALAFLKRNNTIHADIKPENILIKTPSESKVENVLDSLTLVDFGNAIHHTHKEVVLYYSDFDLQTLPYRAPEVCIGKPFGVEIDMWSLGCVLVELYCGKMLFPGATRASVLKGMTQLLGPLPEVMCTLGKFGSEPEIVALAEKESLKEKTSVLGLMSKIPSLKDYSFASFLSGLLCYCPDQRLTPWQALQHPFMAKEICISYFLPDSSVDHCVMGKADYDFHQRISSDVKRMCPSTYDLLKMGTGEIQQTKVVGKNVARIEPLYYPRSVKKEESSLNSNNFKFTHSVSSKNARSSNERKNHINTTITLMESKNNTKKFGKDADEDLAMDEDHDLYSSTGKRCQQLDTTFIKGCNEFVDVTSKTHNNSTSREHDCNSDSLVFKQKTISPFRRNEGKSSFSIGEEQSRLQKTPSSSKQSIMKKSSRNEKVGNKSDEKRTTESTSLYMGVSPNDYGRKHRQYNNFSAVQTLEKIPLKKSQHEDTDKVDLNCTFTLCDREVDRFSNGSVQNDVLKLDRRSEKAKDTTSQNKTIQECHLLNHETVFRPRSSKQTKDTTSQNKTIEEYHLSNHEPVFRHRSSEKTKDTTSQNKTIEECHLSNHEPVFKNTSSEKTKDTTSQNKTIEEYHLSNHEPVFRKTKDTTSQNKTIEECHLSNHEPVFRHRSLEKTKDTTNQNKTIEECHLSNHEPVFRHRSSEKTKDTTSQNKTIEECHLSNHEPVFRHRSSEKTKDTTSQNKTIEECHLSNHEPVFRHRSLEKTKDTTNQNKTIEECRLSNHEPVFRHRSSEKTKDTTSQNKTMEECHLSNHEPVFRHRSSEKTKDTTSQNKTIEECHLSNHEPVFRHRSSEKTKDTTSQNKTIEECHLSNHEPVFRHRSSEKTKDTTSQNKTIEESHLSNHEPVFRHRSSEKTQDTTSQNKTIEECHLSNHEPVFRHRSSKQTKDTTSQNKTIEECHLSNHEPVFRHRNSEKTQDTTSQSKTIGECHLSNHETVFSHDLTKDFVSISGLKNNMNSLDLTNISSVGTYKQANHERYAVCTNLADSDKFQKSAVEGALSVISSKYKHVDIDSKCKHVDIDSNFLENGTETSTEREVIKNNNISRKFSFNPLCSTTDDGQKDICNHKATERLEQDLSQNTTIDKYISKNVISSREINPCSKFADESCYLDRNKKRKCCVDVRYGEKVVEMYGGRESIEKRKASTLLKQKLKTRKYRNESMKQRKLFGKILTKQKRCKRTMKNQQHKKFKVLDNSQMMNNISEIQNYDNCKKCVGTKKERGIYEKITQKYQDDFRGKIDKEQKSVNEEGIETLPLPQRRKVKAVRRSLKFENASEGNNNDNCTSNNGGRRKRVQGTNTSCHEKQLPNVYQGAALFHREQPKPFIKKRLRESLLQEETDHEVSDPYTFKDTPYAKRKKKELSEMKWKTTRRQMGPYSRSNANFDPEKKENVISTAITISELVEQKVSDMNVKSSSSPSCTTRINGSHNASSKISCDDMNGQGEVDSTCKSKKMNDKVFHSAHEFSLAHTLEEGYENWKIMDGNKNEKLGNDNLNSALSNINSGLPSQHANSSTTITRHLNEAKKETRSLKAHKNDMFLSEECGGNHSSELLKSYSAPRNGMNTDVKSYSAPRNGMNTDVKSYSAPRNGMNTDVNVFKKLTVISSVTHPIHKQWHFHSSQDNIGLDEDDILLF